MTDEKLQAILHSLTLPQKIGQMVQLNAGFFDKEAEALVTGPIAELGLDSEYNLYNTGSILNTFDPTKLFDLQTDYLKHADHGIPLLFFGDVLHGFSTIFPIPLAQSCSWNFSAIEKAAEISASEMSAAGIHSTFAPMLDLVREPRWGRVMESPGESPLLCYLFGKHSIIGFQNSAMNAPIDNAHVAGCVKHFAAYGAPEGGREYNTVEMGLPRFYEDYLPPYTGAIKQGARLVMTAFNTLNSVPCSGNKWLNREVLRGKCGFAGVLISDYAAVKELINHGVAANERDAAKLALEAGVDIDMMTSCYANHLQGLVEDGIVDIALIDEAVMRILKLKNDLGLFENPFRGLQVEKAPSLQLLPASKQVALELSEQSIVLLKNHDHVLPIKKNQKIALIGPYGQNPATNSVWALTGDIENNTTLHAGLVEVYGEENVSATPGCSLVDDYSEFGEFAGFLQMMAPELPPNDVLTKMAVAAAKDADVIVLAVGEHIAQSGEGSSRTGLRLPPAQQALVNAISGTGKPIVMVVFAGRPLVMTELEGMADAILYSWLPGTMGGNALANLISGRTNPSGRLSISFPRSEGQIPVFHNMLPTGRPMDSENPKARFFSHYMDEDNAPLYPFGYGLTYGEIEYTAMKMNSKKMTTGGSVQIDVTLQNKGQFDATEVVQLYLHDEVAALSRPAKELKAFERVLVKAGERKTVSLMITEDMLRYHHPDLGFMADAGLFTVMVGPNAEALPLQEKFEFC